MTDKPPAYENQWPAGYGMQSDQPAGGWTTGAAPPQQQGYPPPQFQQPQSQFQQQQQYPPKGTQHVIRHHLNFGKQPVTTTCTNCNLQVTTVVREGTGTFQYVVAGVLCFVGCWPCCLIPFCVNDWQDVTHSCPNCNLVLGRHKFQ